MRPSLPERVAVVGAGTMGRGIAMAYANAGFHVQITDTSAEALERGVAAIRRTYDAAVEKGRVPADEAARRLERIEPRASMAHFDDVQLVTEAVFEDLAVKREVFDRLDRVTRPGAILATNTSYLDLDAIAAATRRAPLVVGHHYSVPAHVMPLVEIVRGRETSPDVIDESRAIVERLGKAPVVVRNSRGFVGNRMYEPYVRESVFLVEEGAAPQYVDRAMREFGMAMGPLAVQDLSGLDIGWRARQASAHLRAPGARYPFAHDLLCERGRFGQKTGAGWYRYAHRRAPEPDDEVVTIIRSEAARRGVVARAIAREEVVDRLVLALVNEGARVLEEGVAATASDIDRVYVAGYGFPAARGGPMRYADSLGLAVVVDRIRALRERLRDHWDPAPLLERLARDGATLLGTFR